MIFLLFTCFWSWLWSHHWKFLHTMKKFNFVNIRFEGLQHWMLVINTFLILSLFASNYFIFFFPISCSCRFSFEYVTNSIINISLVLQKNLKIKFITLLLMFIVYVGQFNEIKTKMLLLKNEIPKLLSLGITTIASFQVKEVLFQQEVILEWIVSLFTIFHKKTLRPLFAYLQLSFPLTHG